jgi:hypothetical protein
MISHELDIHIEWDGSFTLKQVRESKTPIDYGLYQVYGHHPIYGSDVLLYIGQAAKQTFSKRVASEGRWHDNRDAGHLKFYLGRLRGKQTPPKPEWQRQIDLAERLLIMTLSPANNTQKGIASVDSDLYQVHVFNYGHHRDLLPEVSGARWSSRLGEMADYIDYGSKPQKRNRNA